jgi:hypothetical protein
MSSNTKTPIIIGSAIAGGAIATGILCQIIPVIGTGVGAGLIGSGLASLAGGSLATGGGGMIAGLAVFGGITTSSSALGAGLSSAIIEAIEENKKTVKSYELIRELKKYIPNVTNSQDTIDPYTIMLKYKGMFDNNTNENLVWLHINYGYPYIDDSVILSNKKIIHIKNGIICVEIMLENISSLDPKSKGWFYWDVLKITTTNNREIEISINQTEIINKFISVASQIKKMGRDENIMEF